ncbi:MAG: hypothetical protein ABL950_00435, partial [Nitrospira sp.]
RQCRACCLSWRHPLRQQVHGTELGAVLSAVSRYGSRWIAQSRGVDLPAQFTYGNSTYGSRSISTTA